MIRWSFQSAQGCVPTEPSSMPRLPASAASCSRRCGFHERLAAARLGLGLRGDQLADEVRVELGAGGRGLQILEAVDEVARLRVEKRELLLDREREVLRRLELLPGLPEHLRRSELLLVAHRGYSS